MGWFCLFFLKVQENSLENTHLHREFKRHGAVSNHQGTPQREKHPIPTKITVAEERANINPAAQSPCRVYTGCFSIGKQNISHMARHSVRLTLCLCNTESPGTAS